MSTAAPVPAAAAIPATVPSSRDPPGNLRPRIIIIKQLQQGCCVVGRETGKTGRIQLAGISGGECRFFATTIYMKLVLAGGRASWLYGVRIYLHIPIGEKGRCSIVHMPLYV